MSYTKTAVLPVTPDEAFALITQPERLRRWQAVSAVVDLRAGGSYAWTVAPGHLAAGNFHDVDPRPGLAGRRSTYYVASWKVEYLFNKEGSSRGPSAFVHDHACRHARHSARILGGRRAAGQWRQANRLDGSKALGQLRESRQQQPGGHRADPRASSQASTLK